jgi:phenylalanyl-tRNA synthetase beta chain
MGGQDSEISDATTHIVLESATFDARNIRRTSRALRLGTEASKRFDKGLDPELPPVAAARACVLLAELAGARPAAGLVDVRQPAPEPRRVTFTVDDVVGLIGQPYPPEQIEAALAPLGFAVERANGRFEAVVPSWRADVEGKADIAEEVARIVGYDAIPTALPQGRLPRPHEDPILRWEEVLRSALAAAGLQEVINYSLVDPFALSRLEASAAFPPAEPDAGTIPVFNPMSVEQSRLRTTLLPSLLANIASNLRHQERVALFELARVYLPPLAPLPCEERRLAMALAGRRAPATWNAGPEPFDFFDLKAAVEAAFRALRVPMAGLEPATGPWLHPTRGAAVRAEGATEALGVMGQVHPTVVARFDVEGVDIYAAELALEPLLGMAREEIRVEPLPRFPAVQRDLALVVAERFTHGEVAATIRGAAGPLLAGLQLFDIYTGPPIPPGHRSLAYALTFRAPDRTLTDEATAAPMAAIEQAVGDRLGAQIRGRPEGQ